MIAAVVLTLSLWHGASLPAAAANAVKYRLVVQGAPRETVALHARGVPKGWIASFCTREFCAPFDYSATLDSRGRSVLELALVRVQGTALAHYRITISAPGARSVEVKR